jgi:hypothetical protein
MFKSLLNIAKNGTIIGSRFALSGAKVVASHVADGYKAVDTKVTEADNAVAKAKDEPRPESDLASGRTILTHL